MPGSVSGLVFPVRKFNYVLLEKRIFVLAHRFFSIFFQIFPILTTKTSDSIAKIGHKSPIKFMITCDVAKVF